MEEVVKVETTEKVEGFQLTDNRTKSAWEASTAISAPSAPAQAEPDVVQESVKIKPEITPNRVIEIAAAKAESRSREKAKSQLSDLEQASEMTTEFYSALNDGNIGEAYDKLAPEFQADLPFENFQYGYAAVESISCEVKNSEQISPEQIRLDLQIDAYEAGHDTTYYATCILWKTNDEWSIAGVAQLASL